MTEPTTTTTATATASETTATATAAASEAPLWTRVLTRAERKELERGDPLRAWWTVLSNWLGVFGAMALVAWAPNPLTIVLALFIIGARQLGMAVVMHEASHRTLFANRRLNDWVGNWLASYPVWTDPGPYRTYHLKHHAYTGLEGDPDLGLIAPFPITKSSFRRKVWRDLSGQTGIKQAIGVFKRDVGWNTGKLTQRDLSMSLGDRPDVGWNKVAPVAITNGVLLLLLTLVGYPALYLLWVAAWLTTYRLVTRIRSIAEHSVTPSRTDPLNNTRTTHANWLERFFLAPNRVNYHLEHHLLVSVPLHNLPRLHRIMRERGVLDGACLARGYPEVLKLAVSRAEA